MAAATCAKGRYLFCAARRRPRCVFVANRFYSAIEGAAGEPGSLHVSGSELSLPYSGCTILSVLEHHKVPLSVDCRKGICRKCLVEVEVENELFEVLSCQEL